MNKKTIRQSLIETDKKLSKTSLSPSLDAEVILSCVIKKPREFLLANPDIKLTKLQTANYRLLTNRRAKGLPVAYIVGYKEFYGRRFAVNPNALIPRPETEELVDLALAYVKRRTGKQRVLDLGTGSGCIAITLVKELSAAKLDICASDISAAALQIAKANAKTHRVKIKFTRSDLFEKLSKKFDVVVANLPYVRHNDYLKHRDQLAHEPKKALTDASNRWLIYQRFFQQLSGHLDSSGLCVLEIDPQSKQMITKYCRRYFRGVKLRFHKDLAGKYRFAVLQT